MKQITSSEWNLPYSREKAAFPVVSALNMICHTVFYATVNAFVQLCTHTHTLVCLYATVHTRQVGHGFGLRGTCVRADGASSLWQASGGRAHCSHLGISSAALVDLTVWVV